MPDAEAPPAPPTAKRSPQRKLSDAEKKQIEQTLMRDDVRGNISVTAEILGLSYGAVESYIRRTPYLAALAPEKRAGDLVPTEADIIDRAPMDADAVTLSGPQFDQYQQMLRQAKKMLAKDWESMGMTAEQGARMERYATIGASPIGQVIRAGHGQLIKNMDMLDQIIEHDGKMILEKKIPPEYKADGSQKAPEIVEREWRYTLFSGMKLQLEMFTHMNKVQAMLAQAMRNIQAAQIRGQQPPKGKLAASATPPKPSVTAPGDGET